VLFPSFYIILQLSSHQTPTNARIKEEEGRGRKNPEFVGSGSDRRVMGSSRKGEEDERGGREGEKKILLFHLFSLRPFPLSMRGKEEESIE